MVNGGGDGPDTGWLPGPGRAGRGEYLPPAESPAPPPRRAGGRHGRPGAPDSRPPAQARPGYPPPLAAPSPYGTGEYGRPEYDPSGYRPPEYGPATPVPGASADPYAGRPDPYAGVPGPSAGRPAPYGPPAGHEPPESYSQPGARATDQGDPYGAPGPYGPPDPYRAPAGHDSGPFPRAGTGEWPGPSGPPYQAGALDQAACGIPAPRAVPTSGTARARGPHGRRTARAAAPMSSSPPPGRCRPGPRTATGCPAATRSAATRSAATPGPHGAPGPLPGLPPAAGPPGRSEPFRWEPPEEYDSPDPGETGTALWRNGRPVGPAGFAGARSVSGPESAFPAGRTDADRELPRDSAPWDDRPGSDGYDAYDGGSYEGGSHGGASYGGGSRGGGEPGPDPEADEPDWSGDERHPGFFRGFGDDENVDPPKRRHGRWIAPVISLVIIVVILGTGGGILAHMYAARHANYAGAGTGTLTFTVRSGDTATTLAPKLVKDGVIKSTDPFIAAAKESANADALTPGTFRLHHHMNATLAWNLLVNPSSRVQTMVVIPPGLRAADILKRLAADTGKPLSQFQAAYADTSALGLPSYAHGNPEGFLFPATYPFQPGTTPVQMLREMVTEFTQQVSSINLAAAAAHAQFSEEQVITAASLLEAEAEPGDYAKVARVIDNRLNLKMPLQFDSTVLYALHITGFNLTTTQLHVASPYNTFLHTGLPPGPIDSPGLQAIEAVLHPAAGNWTYFVTVDPKSGLTKFTNNYAQFQQWVTQSNKNIADGK